MAEDWRHKGGNKEDNSGSSGLGNPENSFKIKILKL
jgi:hypothetical protein